MTRLHQMTLREIEREIWRNEPPHKLIGLRDKFTDDEIASLPSHPAWDLWPSYFRSWVYMTLE